MELERGHGLGGLRHVGRRQSRRVGRVPGGIEGPFQPGHIGKIDQRGGGRIALQECRERRAIGAEPGFLGRVSLDESDGGGLEKPVADQAMEHRIGRLERLGVKGTIRMNSSVVPTSASFMMV